MTSTLSPVPDPSPAVEVAGVVCPLAVIPAWKRAFAHFGKQPPLFVLNYESLRTGPKPPGYLRGGDRPYWRPMPGKPNHIQAATFAEAINTSIKEARKEPV